MRVSFCHGENQLSVDVHPEAGKYRLVIDGDEHLAEAHYLDEETLLLLVDGRRYRVDITRHGKDRLVAVGGEVYTFAPESAAAAHHVAALASPEIVAPMPGKVLQVLVRPGDHVEIGDGLLILEAMKMENRLIADAPGTVDEVHVAAGDTVEGGQVLAILRYDEEAAS